MKTTAVRLYGKKDLRLESFELPPIKDDEILAKVVADSLCMSSYKASSQATEHKRIPDDVADHPIIIGHEFCGKLRALQPPDVLHPSCEYSVSSDYNVLDKGHRRR